MSSSSCIVGRLSLIRVCCVPFGAWLLGRSNYDASGLLNFRRCCALRLEGKGQVGIIPICVSFDRRMMPCCSIFSRLPTSACASRHAPCIPCLSDQITVTANYKTQHIYTSTNDVTHCSFAH
jgi:hypothetical protein